MTTNSTHPRIPNAAELEPLLTGDLNDLTAEILPDLPNSFAGEVGEAVYEMAESGALINAEEVDFFDAISAEIEESDKTWLDRLAEGDWGYFAFAAAEAVQGTWMENVLDLFLPDFLDLQAQKEQVLRLTQNPHNILINLRERVDRASAIPGMETEAFGLPVADIETLINHLEGNDALLESFPYEGDAEAQADWWADAFTSAGLVPPSAVVLSVLSGEAEWTLFLGDANQRILQQILAEDSEIPEEAVLTEMTEVDGVMMHPEYGEMVLLEDTEFVAAVHNTGSEIRQFVENNSGLMRLAAGSFLLEGTGGVTGLGTLSGIASLPLEHPAISGASFLLLMEAEEDVSEAYYPRDREAFMAFIRAKAEASTEPFAENVSFLSDEDLSQLYDWAHGLESPNFSGLSASVRAYLNPTPENQWREHQIRAFRTVIPNYLRYPLNENSAITAKLSEIVSLYGSFDADTDINFDSELVQTKIEELNNLLSAHDYRLIEDGNYLYIERPERNNDTGETIMVRYSVALNPALDIEQQWQVSTHFFAEHSALETLRMGVSASTLEHFAEAMRVVEEGEGVFAYVEGAWSFVSGTAVEIVPEELVLYMIGAREYDGLEWSSQQFAYAYGETVAPLAVIGAARGLRGGVTGMLRGALRGIVSPISSVYSVGIHAGRAFWNRPLFNARTQARARTLYHGGLRSYGDITRNTSMASHHRELEKLEALRGVLADYEYGGIRNRVPRFAEDLITRANDIISDAGLKLPFTRVTRETVSVRLSTLDTLIERERTNRLVQGVGERVTGAQSAPDRVRAIEAGDALIENVEQQKASRVRRFIQALNSGDSNMMAYAQEQLTRQVQNGERLIRNILPIRRTAFEALSETDRVRVGSAQSLLERLRGRIELPHLSPRGRLGLAAGVAALAGVLLLERVLADEDAVAGSRPTTEELLAENGMGTLSPRADQTSFSPLETTFIQRFETLDLVQGLSANDASSRLTPEGVDALVENHELVINDLREALTEPANQAALRTILEEAEDQRLEIGTVALTLEDGEVFLHSTTPSRFEDVYWQMVDQVDGTFQQWVASTTGSEILGYAADMSAYLVPFVGPGRDLTNAWTDFQRGNWRSFANNALFGVVGGAIDTIAWGGSLVTLGGSAVVGTGAKGALAAVRTGIRAPRAIRAAKVARLGLMGSQVGGAAYSIFQGSHNRHERLF